MYKFCALFPSNDFRYRVRESEAQFSWVWPSPHETFHHVSDNGR